MMEPRRISVFFHGLFMDVELLGGKGSHPGSPRRAAAIAYALRIGPRATLVPEADKRAAS